MSRLKNYEVPDDTVLWRYMDLSKLLDMLVNNHIVFPRLDSFEDIYEGQPQKYKDAIHKAFTIEGIQDKGVDYNAAIDIYYKLSKVRTYISCWHMNNYESAGMWKLYCKTNESIAIRTTLGKLKNSLTTPDSDWVGLIEFGKVDYEDNTDFLVSQYINEIRSNKPASISHHEIFFAKRPSFEHEKELRAVAYNPKRMLGVFQNHLSPEDLKKTTPYVQSIECNLENLIDGIVIAPDAKGWFVETVKKTIIQLGFKFDVTQSDLYTLK